MSKYKDYGYTEAKGNSTILFEFFNEEAPSFTKVMSDFDNKDNFSESDFRRFEEELVVTSFEEFLDKFAPTLYSVEVDGKLQVTTKNPNIDGIVGKKLSKDDKILMTFLSIIDKKNKSGESNLDFEFERILEFLSPKSIVDDAKNLRAQLERNEKKLNKLDDESPEFEEISDKIFEIREKITNTYKHDHLALLPLAIEDINVKLKFSGSDSSTKETEKTLLNYGRTNFNNVGELVFLPYDVNNTLQEEEKNEKLRYIEWVGKDYDVVSKDNHSDFTKSLVLTAFGGSQDKISSVDDVRKLKALKDIYLNKYKENLSASIKQLKSLIQKILGVKLFFEQSQVEKPKLLIINEKGVTLSKHIVLLEKFLKTSNDNLKKYNWNLAIIPGVTVQSGTRTKKRNLDDAITAQGDNIIQDESFEKTTLSIATELSDLLAKYKVLTMINFEANRETSFEVLFTNGLKGSKDGKYNTLELMKKLPQTDFTVPVYPNFTVIPFDKAISLGETYKLDETTNMYSNEKESIRTYLEGVYLDASYVAAGMIASYINPKELDKRNIGEIDKENLLPAFRFDIESKDFAEKFVSTIGREGLLDLPKDVKDEINDVRKGIVFTSTTARIESKPITNMIMYQARNMFNKPIFIPLTKTYLERISSKMIDHKKSKMDEFEKFIRDMKDHYNHLNGISRTDSELTFKKDEKKIKLNFPHNIEEFNLIIEE